MAFEEDEQLPNTIKALYSSSTGSIPTEIIVEILARLPVESVLRCKSVCKSWRSLISNPYFVKYHLSLSTTNHHYTHHHILVSSSVLGNNLQCCSLYDVIYDDHNPINPLKLDYPMKNSCKSVSIVGSCNGLICILVDSYTVFIWNPTTRKSIQLPEHPYSPKIPFVYVMRGFGYIESSDDYIVVEICFSVFHRDNKKVTIYSSNNGTWKEIGGFPHSNWWCDSDVLLNGALHWASFKDHAPWSIVYLDLAKETYSEFLPPVYDYGYEATNLELRILGDSLCALCQYSSISVDVWVMKVYGVKDSWFKLVSIPYDLGNGSVQYGINYFSAPLCVTEDGKILLQKESRLIVFDSRDVSVLESQNFKRCSQACIFVESLVSLTGEVEVK